MVSSVGASGFGTGGADPADGEPEEEEADEQATSPSETLLFKKKSNLTLPTLGIDASDWYDEDEDGD